VHVPFCARRCGYCDFNTYTAVDLGGGAAQAAYADLAIKEMTLAREALERSADAGSLVPGLDWPWAELQWVARPAETVFFGGGTPTVLPAVDLIRLLEAVRALWGLVSGAEVSVEANPESVDQAYLENLAEGGFTRVSLGMQSSSERVLAALGRTHRPEQVTQAVSWARAADLAVSVDLIYGAPGETMGEWSASLEAALALGVDHVSCYALTIESGTPLGRELAVGRVSQPSDEDLADKYELADQVLSAAGLTWYEISNWAVPGHECRHNLGYWQRGEWWGVGPGAHSAIGPARFWNVTHPREYAQVLAAGALPIADGELVTGSAAILEYIMLGMRLSEGLPKAVLASPGQDHGEVPAKVSTGLAQLVAMGRGEVPVGVRPGIGQEAVDKPGDGREKESSSIAQLVSDGLIEDLGEAIRLTRRGRLLADVVTRVLADT